MCIRLFLLASLAMFCEAVSAGKEDPLIGVVVEKVGKLSALEKAGIKPGDLLLSWERLPNENTEGAKGKFDSIFNWYIFLDEQAPQGRIQIHGERISKKTIFQIRRGDWSASVVRPVMPLSETAEYLKGKGLLSIGKISEGIIAWENVFQIAQSKGFLRISCWLQIKIGRTWMQHQDWEKADFALDLAMEIAEGQLAQVYIWRLIGEAYEKRNQLTQAENAIQKQVEAWRLICSDCLGLANSIEQLGRLALKQGKQDLAEEQYERSLKIRESLAPDSLELASSLNGLGTVAWSRGDLETSTKYFQSALGIRKKIAPGGTCVAGSYHNLGSVLFDQGDLDNAEVNYIRALHILEILVPNSLDLSATLNNLGNVANMRGDLGLSIEYYERALNIANKLAPQSLDVAKCLANLGLVAHDRGELNDANDYLDRALAIAESVAPNSSEVAAIFNNLGLIAYNRGQLNLSAKYYKRALAIWEKFAPRSLDVAGSYSNLGAVAYQRKNFDAANIYFQRALTITEKLSPDSLEVAGNLNNMGLVASEQGNLVIADTYYKRALAINDRKSPGSIRVAHNLNNLGITAFERGIFTSAKAYFERALAITESLMPGGLERAISLYNLGHFFREIGDFDTSALYFEKANEIVGILATGSTVEAMILNGFAKTKVKLDMIEDAELQFGQSIEAHELQLGKVGGSSHAMSQFQGGSGEFYRDYILLLMSQNKAELAFDIHERARARILHQIITERDLTLSRNDIPGELEGKRKRIVFQIENLQQEREALDYSEDGDRIRQLNEGLLDLRRAYEKVIEDTRAISPRLANLRAPKILDHAQVRKVLNPGTTMLSYCVTEEKTFLFVVRKHAEIMVHTIEQGEADFRGKVNELHSLVGEPKSKVSRAMLEIISRDFFNLLITPAKKEIEGCSQILILPDGPLQKLPFNLLQDEKGRYLIELKPITTAVSATIFAELKARETKDNFEISAFGAPHLLGFLQDNSRELEPLPYTEEEVNAIKRAFPNDTSLYLGQGANEKNVKSLGNGPNIIHFATHGWFNDRFPLESALAFAFNTAFKEGEENGILQAWEIFNDMRIDADLVVLSGCNTGQGEVQGTEGLIGLTRAFQYAGARSIIASYWKINDGTTAVLMEKFYRYLKSGKDKAEALRQAQIELIRSPIKLRRTGWKSILPARTVDASHPYYWAAFQLIGPWD